MWDDVGLVTKASITDQMVIAHTAAVADDSWGSDPDYKPSRGGAGLQYAGARRRGIGLR